MHPPPHARFSILSSTIVHFLFRIRIAITLPSGTVDFNIFIIPFIGKDEFILSFVLLSPPSFVQVEVSFELFEGVPKSITPRPMGDNQFMDDDDDAVSSLLFSSGPSDSAEGIRGA